MKYKKTTMQDIADRLGTSKVTISRVLNNQEGVSEGLRQQIIQVAIESGYPVSPALLKKVDCLAFVIPERFYHIFDKFYSIINRGIEKKCSENNIILQTYVIDSLEEKKGEIPALLKSGKFSGIFLVSQINNLFLENIAALKIPCVFVDYENFRIPANQVLVDNYRLGFEATNYLIDNGHTKIGFVGNYINSQNYCDRYLGYRRALLLNEIIHNPSYDFSNSNPITGLYTLDFNLPNPMPTALVCSSDYATFYVYEKLKSVGLSVPDDVSVISFDNTAICSTMSPPLTSFDINKQSFTENAFNILIQSILSPRIALCTKFVTTKAVIRQSVKLLYKDIYSGSDN